MDAFGSKRRIDKLDDFLKEFESKQYEDALQRMDHHPICVCSSRLLGLNENEKEEIASKIYIHPREGVDDALTAYFNLKSKGKRNGMGAQKDCSKVLVCGICAGFHSKTDCNVRGYFVCHMCGQKGHRMFECKRSKCYLCLDLGHLAAHCPRRKAVK